MDSKLVSLTEHNTVKAREGAEHEEALNSALKEVADRLREKQNASKRGAGGAAGRKDLRDDDGMDVDEPAGSETARNENRKYVRSHHHRIGVSLDSVLNFFLFRAPQEMVKTRTKRNRM